MSKICPFYFQNTQAQLRVGGGGGAETLKLLKNSQVNPWHLNT